MMIFNYLNLLSNHYYPLTASASSSSCSADASSAGCGFFDIPMPLTLMKASKSAFVYETPLLVLHYSKLPIEYVQTPRLLSPWRRMGRLSTTFCCPFGNLTFLMP